MTMTRSNTGMTDREIARASSALLRARLREDSCVGAEMDAIGDELSGRAHDLEDPSSGLGNQGPS